jgi:hypothetical protein
VTAWHLLTMAQISQIQMADPLVLYAGAAFSTVFGSERGCDARR